MDTIIPPGFCQCGCGGKTGINRDNDPRLGYVKGEPRRFLRGHYHKRSDPIGPERYTLNPATGCWVWQGFLYAGYGLVKIEGRSRRPHRVSYERRHGPIPEGMELDHLCRNRACINPEHLEAVTKEVNAQRGKGAKLTPERVRVMRFLAGSMTHRDLAKKFGVSTATVHDVLHRHAWKNI